MANTPKWNPQGYQKLAQLTGRYPEAAIFRRFGSLSILGLLSLQAKLVVLDREYREICYSDDSSAVENVHKYSTYFLKLHEAREPNDAQLRKLNEIRKVVNEYYEELLRAAQVAQLSRPTKHQVRFLHDWLEGEQEGNNFLDLKERFTWDAKHELDFITLAPSSSWINPRLLDFFHWLGHIGHEKEPEVVEAFDAELGRVKDYDSALSVRIIRVLWKVCLTLLASMLPVLAILVLYFVKPTLYRIAIAVGFTTLVGLFLIVFTSANVKEVFGATAAFAAVVVVFIGSANSTTI